MTFRSAPWRRCCPEVVGRAIDEALRATIYIVHEAGPTGFVLKQEGEPKKVKVFLGDQHNCSCALFRKKHEVCLHILWILLKKFRVPRENPVIWQLGLIEREINEILLGHLRKQSPVHSATSSDKRAVQRDIGPDDVCPICQDELLSSVSQKALTFCKYSCGKSVHLKCMKIWAEHQRSTGESVTRCPLCRENFGPITEMPSKSPRRIRAEKAFLHLGMACTHCHVCPIAGKCYRCCQCASYYLCHACFSSNQVHLLHPFEVRQHCNQPWREAERPRDATSIPPSDSPALPPALINSLQSRSLTENDYEILLQLDNSNANTTSASTMAPPTGRGEESQSRQQSRGSVHQQHSRQSVPERVINSFHVEPLDGNHPLISGRDSCQICYSVYDRGDWVRKLPCKHKFHRECIDEWFRSNHITCPIDGQPVYDPTHQRQRTTGRLLPLRRTQHHRRRSTARRRQLAPLSQAAQQSRQENGAYNASDLGSRQQAEFSISGHSIIGGGAASGQQAVSKKSTKGKKSSGLRRGTSSHPPSKKLSTGNATFLPKLEQHSNIIHLPLSSTQSARQAENLSLPKINSSSDNSTTLGQIPSTSHNNMRLNSTKRLTIQIPSASGDSAPSSTKEKQPKASNSHNSTGKMQSTIGTLSKSRSQGLTEQSNEHSLLAPICNSYSGSVNGQPRQRSDKQLIEESPCHQLAMGEEVDVHEDGEGQLQVVPAINNLSASRFTELKQASVTSSVNSLSIPTSGSRRLRRGSVVVADKAMKRSISLRESASDLLDTSLQVSTFKLPPPQEHGTAAIIVPSSLDMTVA